MILTARTAATCCLFCPQLASGLNYNTRILVPVALKSPSVRHNTPPAQRCSFSSASISQSMTACPSPASPRRPSLLQSQPCLRSLCVPWHPAEASFPMRQFHSSRSRNSVLGTAASIAESIVTKAVKSKVKQLPEPLQLVAKEMKALTGNLRMLIGSGHPILDQVAKYYTLMEGKHMRPLLVLLMSRATALCPKSEPVTAPRLGPNGEELTIDTPMTLPSILNDSNPELTNYQAASSLMSFSANSERDKQDRANNILPAQRRLADITELIHTASLLHDDVIDHASMRRGSLSANVQFSNKMAVLAGDFLLGRASVALARLRNTEVIELLGTVIANLVEGEFMQLKNTAEGEKLPTWNHNVLPYYLEKTYLKTASLISKSCRAAALLGGADRQTVDAAYLYGKRLGLAFQLVDDMLDWTRSTKEMGKPTGADLELGLATAPLLFAWEKNPKLGALVGRHFSQPGDVEQAQEWVLQSDGIQRTRELAESYAYGATDAISGFPESEAKDALISMAEKTINRKK